MLSWYEPEPGSEISRLVERFRPANRGHERRCVQSADAGDRCQAPGHLVGGNRPIEAASLA
jgi:hypothetical protein